MSDRSRELIEGSAIPDLERLAMQELLNGMTERGELSGPPIKEDGQDSPVFQKRLREREARMGILGTAIAPARPRDTAEWSAARLEDQRAVDDARKGLGDIPDESGQNKAVCVKKVRELEEKYKQKWEAGAAVVAELGRLLALPPGPGSLRLADGRFDRAAIVGYLDVLSQAEALHAELSQDEPQHAELGQQLIAYREAVVLGLGSAPAPVVPAPMRPPLPAKPGTGDLSPEPEAEKPRPKVQTGPMQDPDDLAFMSWCIDVAPLSPAKKAAMLAQLEAEGAGPRDRKVGHLASAIVLANPNGLTNDLLERMDEPGLRSLAGRTGEPVFANMTPGARMGLVKHVAGMGDGPTEARGVFGGALAADLVRQHPRALNELLASIKGPVIQGMARALADDELYKLGRENLHALYKAIGAPTSDEARRQAARVVRLANRK
jgi:hypothetical protein